MARAFIFLAEGFEDVEAIGTADVLRRGGVDVELVSIGEDPFVVSSHGVTVGADATLETGVDIAPEDVMVFPGGMPGTKHLAACRPLMDFMKEHYAEGGPVAAICAAPGLVLSQLDGLAGLEMTCFDGFEEALVAKGARFVRKPAVASGRLVTGRSAGHALAFGLEILKLLKGEEKAAEVSYALHLTCE